MCLSETKDIKRTIKKYISCSRMQTHLLFVTSFPFGIVVFSSYQFSKFKKSERYQIE